MKNTGRKTVIHTETFLLIVIFAAFISLGVPDSLFGTAWPAIYKEFGIPFSYGSYATAIIYFGTMFSAMFSARIIKRFGTGKVAAFSTLATAVSMVGYSLVPSYPFLFLCAIPLGLGAGAIDTGLNNYVAKHYSASHMSFLHCFYGVGITLSPLVLSGTMKGRDGWRNGYFIAFLIQIAIALLLTLSLPLWTEAEKNEKESGKEEIRALSSKELFGMKNVKTMIAIFFCSCGLEAVCDVWGSTYLVETRGMTPASAATVIIFYFAGMALGRFLSGIFTRWLSPYKVIAVGLFAALIGLLCMFISSDTVFCVLGFFLIGVGNAPVYPNLSYLTPKIFGDAEATSILGAECAAGSLAFIVVPLIVGEFTGIFGMRLFPYFTAAFLLAVILGYTVIRRKYGRR